MNKNITISLIVIFMLQINMFAQNNLIKDAQKEKVFYISGNSINEMIFTAEEIDVKGTITKLKINFTKKNNNEFNEFKIYLKHTKKHNFSTPTDWIDIKNFTEVWNVNNKKNITKDGVIFDINDWDYNGNDNLAIAIVNNTSDFKAKVLIKNTTNNQTLFYSGKEKITDTKQLSKGSLGEFVFNTTFYGATKDCPAPSNLSANNIKLNAADLSWTENGVATSWDIELGEYGFAHSGTPTQSSVSNPYTYEGLLANKKYSWYVRANCGEGIHSSWVGPYDFTTDKGRAANPVPASYSTNISVTDTTLSWDAVENANGYYINIGTSFSENDVLENYYVSTNSYTFPSNFDYGTKYYWNVNTVYNVDDVVYGYRWNFSTECNIHIPEVLEQFNGITSFPICWKRAKGLLENTGTNLTYGYSAWRIDDFGNIENENYESAALNIIGSIKKDWLISPSINLGSNNNYQLEFDISLTNYNYPGEYPDGMGPDDLFAVVISLDNGQSWIKSNILRSWTSDYQISPIDEHIIIDLTGYSGIIKIGFYGESTLPYNDESSSYDVFIDNFQLRTPPDCYKPKFLQTLQTNTNSAVLSWTQPNNAISWDIELGEKGFQPTGTPTATGITNPYEYPGLNPDTYYEWYVRANCGDGFYSEWTGPSEFLTECAPVDIPYLENFDKYNTPSLPHCMSQINVDNNGSYWRRYSYEAMSYSKPNYARILRDPDVNTQLDDDDWLFTAELNLTGGIEYRLTFYYKAERENTIEKLDVYWGNKNTVSGMSNGPIFNNDNITNNDWEKGTATFTPSTSGTYYIGFHAYSLYSEAFVLDIDDILVEPVVTNTTTESTWLGSASTDWFDSANWSNGIPDNFTKVIIPSNLTNYPVINKNIKCYSIILLKPTEKGDTTLSIKNKIVDKVNLIIEEK
jgi:hypothetical protein